MASIAEYVAQGFPYAVAYEKNANDRAQVDLYESAAHKEMYANARAKAEGWTGDPVTGQSAVSRKEQDANARAKAAGFPGGAVQQEMDANARAIDAGFTSAVDQEIDANRRARDAGYLNAADYESGLRTRRDPLKFPFVDPRDEVWTGPPAPYHIDTANEYIWDEKTGNPVYVGTGLGTGVGNLISQQNYAQPASPNFASVMPNVSYSPQFEALTSGQGKFFAPWSTGQATPAGLLNYQVPGGDPANVTYTGGNPNLFNTNTDGTTFSGGTNTDAQGNKWIMSNGQWIRADSDLGSILSAGDTPRHPLGHYDSNGMWVGSEGTQYDSSGWEMTQDGTYTGAHTSDLGKVNFPGYVRDVWGDKTDEWQGFSFTPASERTDTVSQAQRDEIAGTSFFDPSDE